MSYSNNSLTSRRPIRKVLSFSALQCGWLIRFLNVNQCKLNIFNNDGGFKWSLQRPIRLAYGEIELEAEMDSLNFVRERKSLASARHNHELASTSNENSSPPSWIWRVFFDFFRQ